MAKAWEVTPSAVLCGATPQAWAKDLKELAKIKSQFTTTKQDHANLSEADADEFYELYFALLEYTNNQRNINPSIKRIFRQKFLDVNQLQPIDQYLWSHKKIIDRFIKENPYDFTNDMLTTIKKFKTAISGDDFVVVGFEKDYTKIYSTKKQKIYMVKGIRSNLDELIPKDRIPLLVRITLLNYKDQIIYSSYYESIDIDLGAGWKKQLAEECKTAETCYLLP